MGYGGESWLGLSLLRPTTTHPCCRFTLQYDTVAIQYGMGLERLPSKNAHSSALLYLDLPILLFGICYAMEYDCMNQPFPISLTVSQSYLFEYFA